MRSHLSTGVAPPNDKAPELTPSEALCETTSDTTAQPVYHDIPPMSYPRQEICRSRRGGWELVRWDGYGLELRAWRPYRYLIHDLLDRIGGRLTEAAADVVIGGRR